jgi:diacylglycerol kinase family enzyme
LLANNTDAQISLIEDASDFESVLKRLANSESEIIVAGGGDGTVSAIAAALVGTNKTLGVLPLGTLNHFARD